MTTVQRVAQVFGWIFIIVGVAGFFYAPSMDTGMLLGIFPVNLLLNLVHIALGIWGVWAARTLGAAKTYGIVAGVIFLVLALVGWFMPAGFGLLPLGGNNVWAHVLLGVVLLWAGLAARPIAAEPVHGAV